MRGDDRFEGLNAFLVVARRRSFRAAAGELGVTPGAVSQVIRALEKRVGQPLFQRTTRSVALTEAGEQLFARVSPASLAISEALGAIEDMGGRPAGLLRLSVPRLAVPLFITPVLPRFRSTYPEIRIEISVDDAFVDLTSRGFDAGIRIGESVAKDMVAIRLSPPIRWCVVGAPSYFSKHGHPRSLPELLDHQTVSYRRAGTEVIYRWELEEKGRARVIDPSSDIVVNDGELGLELARRGLGLLYTADIYIQDDLARGTLVTTLDEFSPRSSGFFIYFAAGSQEQPKLRAFVDMLRETAGSPTISAKRKRAKSVRTS